MPPVRWGGWRLRRQYIAVAAVFAVLLVVSFVSFARLMMGQLSRSYMEDVLLSGKAQAEELARQLQGQGNLYKAVETQREALSQISAALSRQQVIDKVQVFNEQGKLVWQSEFVTEGVKGGFPEGNLELQVPIAPVKVTEKTKTYQFRARPDEVGTVVLSVSKPAIAARIAILHRKLIVNTAFAGGTSLLVLIGAIVFIWHLVQRNAQLDAKRRLHEELAALGSLAANLAHEIRNPLNAISINLELLEEDLDARHTPVETVGMARREVGRLSRLVNDFLVYARPSPPVPERFEANVLIRDIAALLAPTCDRLGVELVVGERRRVRVGGPGPARPGPDEPGAQRRPGDGRVRRAPGRAFGAAGAGPGRLRGQRHRAGDREDRAGARARGLLHPEEGRHRPRPCDRGPDRDGPRRFPGPGQPAERRTRGDGLGAGAGMSVNFARRCA